MHQDFIPDQCEHIKDNGIRCGSPAMRGRDFCYYHRRLHDTTILPGDSTYQMPALETEHAVQLAVTHILRAMLKGKIDRATALSMFAGIRIAQSSIRHAEDPTERSFHDIQFELTPAMERLEKKCGTDISVCAEGVMEDGRPRPSLTGKAVMVSEAECPERIRRANYPINADTAQNALENSNHENCEDECGTDIPVCADECRANNPVRPENDTSAGPYHSTTSVVPSESLCHSESEGRGIPTLASKLSGNSQQRRSARRLAKKLAVA